MLRPWDPTLLPRGPGVVQLTVRQGIASLCLSSPARRNAISIGMMADLGAAVAALEARTDLRAVLLSGEAGAFCAGGDLQAVREHLLLPGVGAAMCGYMTDVLDRLSRLPAVVVAAVEGPALGGGAELLVAADLICAAEGCLIGFVQASLGISPGWGGGRRLVRRLGERQALRLLALAPRLDAAEALRVGLVDEVVADGQALAAAEAVVTPLLHMTPEAVQAAVKIARGSADEAACFAALWGGAAHQAALARLSPGRAG